MPYTTFGSVIQYQYMCIDGQNNNTKVCSEYEAKKKWRNIRLRVILLCWAIELELSAQISPYIQSDGVGIQPRGKHVLQCSSEIIVWGGRSWFLIIQITYHKPFWIDEIRWTKKHIWISLQINDKCWLSCAKWQLLTILFCEERKKIKWAFLFRNCYDFSEWLRNHPTDVQSLFLSFAFFQVITHILSDRKKAISVFERLSTPRY